MLSNREFIIELLVTATEKFHKYNLAPGQKEIVDALIYYKRRLGKNSQIAIKNLFKIVGLDIPEVSEIKIKPNVCCKLPTSCYPYIFLDALSSYDTSIVIVLDGKNSLKRAYTSKIYHGTKFLSRDEITSAINNLSDYKLRQLFAKDIIAYNHAKKVCKKSNG